VIVSSIAVAVALIALAAVAVQSLRFTWKVSPWSSVGWLAILLYCGYDLTRIVTHANGVFAILPYADYGLLTIVTIAFIVGGVRDEGQAEPWYWPNHRGQTRAQSGRRGR